MPSARHQPKATAAGPPALIVGGSGSNSGKTVTTLALLCTLRARGLRVQTAKVGPDYIDTAFHAGLSGRPAANLDIWMAQTGGAGPGRCRPAAGPPPGLSRLVARMCAPAPASQTDRHTDRLPDRLPPDLLLTEGAMGLFDGGAKGVGSTAQLAAVLGWPVLLVLATQGLGQSVAALAEGFLQHRPCWLAAGQDIRFAGLVCTHLGSPRHTAIVREALAPVCARAKIPLLGLLPRAGAPLLPSRHLGLHEARESLPGLDITALAQWLETHCDIPALLRRLGLTPQENATASIRPVASATGRTAAPAPARAGLPAAPAGLPLPPHPLSAQAAFFPPRHGPVARRKRYCVGIARDAAFSFCYADLPALLGELGAECVFFSPLADAAPPPCHGLYLPGGYPELHASELAANRPMLAALRQLAGAGLPVYGECGGYIYLMRSIEMEGRVLPMSGLLPLTSRLGKSRAALGYRQAEALPGWPLAQGSDKVSGQVASELDASGLAAAKRPLRVRGHEFHYASLTANSLPASCTALWRLRDSQGADLGPEGCRYGNVAGSWLHLYPEGARRFWRSWLAALPARLP